MKVLMLAPEPFFQERGTPIAVDHVLRVLSQRGDQVDLIVYHEGENRAYHNVRIHRTPALPFLRNIRPGFSWKKLVCDVCMMSKSMVMAARHKYDLVHAVEEASLMALILKRLFGIPYIYDMDSSIGQQMQEQYASLSAFANLFTAFERAIVRNAMAVLPVCEALADSIQSYGPNKVTVIHDVSLLHDGGGHSVPDLRTQLGISGPLLIYVGNLEPYQGIDLLLDSFALAQSRVEAGHLVIIGGKASDTAGYAKKCRDLGIADRVHLTGPRSIKHLAAYLNQADILVSPRAKGNNTPMKLYSYLHSGKAVLATELRTHTQILDSNVAMLAEATAESFGAGMAKLLEDPALRHKLGSAGKLLVEQRHTFPVLREKLDGLYDWVSQAIKRERSPYGT